MTHAAQTIARAFSAARHPMVLRRETVRATVAFDRKLPRVQRYTLLTVPR
jgi:hypothetical protein